MKISNRILYEASSNSEWGEHELDYILMLRAREPVTLAPNPEEVQDTEWVAREHLQDFLGDLESRGVGITPWFKLCTKVGKSRSSNIITLHLHSTYNIYYYLLQELLPYWWQNLERLEEISDNKIHNFYDQ